MARSPYADDATWNSRGDGDLLGEERLPWLESDDDLDYEPGLPTGRLVLFGVIALVLLAVVIGGVWWLFGRNVGEPPADGSIIAAPEEPYKVKPEDEGGKTFAGTGDTSFAVGEGQTREGRLAERAPTPTPTPTTSAPAPSIASTISDEPAAAPRPSPAPTPTAEPVPAGTAVQVGAFPRRDVAEEAWQRLTRQTEALSGVRHRVVEARVDIGRVYRLQALPGDRASAQRLCSALKSDGLACFVK